MKRCIICLISKTASLVIYTGRFDGPPLLQNEVQVYYLDCVNQPVLHRIRTIVYKYNRRILYHWQKHLGYDLTAQLNNNSMIQGGGGVAHMLSRNV